MEEDQYKTISKESNGDFRDRGSKFPSVLFHCESLDQLDLRIQELKKEHPNARHFCYGVILSEGDIMKSNDDGEPSGTAGLPILNQLQSAELVDVASVVIRYFGGTKLGKPGLINAYKKSAKDAIQHAKILTRVWSSDVLIEFSYDDTGEVMKIVERISYHKILHQTFQETCTMQVSVARSALNDVLHLFDHSNSISIRPFDKSSSDL